MVPTAMPQQSAGATANFLSATTIVGLKHKAGKDTGLTAAQSKCFAQIPDHAISQTYQTLLQSSFLADELAAFDAFYSSSLGSRLVQVSLTGTSAKTAFTAKERSQLEAEITKLSINRVWSLRTDANFRQQEAKAANAVVDACFEAV